MSMSYFTPLQLVNNEYPLPYHSLFDSPDSLSDINRYAVKYIQGLVNNYIVRLYRDVIVVANIVSRRISNA